MGRVPFEEKTNEEIKKEKEKKKTEREGILEYLTVRAEESRDFNLKYDISLCLEILQGKENMEVKELKDAVLGLATENERLIRECDTLQIKLLNKL